MSAVTDDDADARPADDAGFTLLELIVAIGLFSVFVAIFITSVTGLAAAVTKTKVTSESASTNQVVIGMLSRQVPYAEAINRPGPGLADPTMRYIEFQQPRSATADLLRACIQWRYVPDEQILQSRTWSLTAGGSAINTTGWATRATDVIDLGALTTPFAMLPADPGAGLFRQQLVVTLASGVSGTEVTSTATRLVARNSSASSVTNLDANLDGQSDTMVCMQAGGRP